MLIGRGIYYGQRGGLMGGSVVGAVRAQRPVWNPADYRRSFDSDYLSFPRGYYSASQVLPMKYGGIGMSSVGSMSGALGISAWVTGAATFDGTCVVSAALTGLKDSPCYIYGTGALSAGPRGTGTISCSVSIGAQPSAFDIAQAVWGMDNGIETGWTPRQIMRVMAAVLAGKVSGAGSNAPVFRAITDAEARVNATTDASGNRTSVTLNPD